MKNKKLIIAVAAFVAVLALFVGVYFATRPDTTAGTKTFTLTVVHGNGTSKDFTITTQREFLADALLDKNLIVESDSPGMYNTVDGETADYSVNQSYWGFYVDGEYAMEGMNTTPIVDGGKYKLEYTVYVAEE